MANAALSPWRHGSERPESVALQGEEATWTYGRFLDGIAAVAGALRAHGVEPGDRVLLIAPSVPEFPPAYFGTLAAGATVVAMNPLATVSEISYVLEDSSCVAALVWHECTDAATSACGEEVELWRLGPALDGVPEAPPSAGPEPRAEDDTAVILYTSGTTGRPKGAELTHANLLATVAAFTEMLEISADDRTGTALPLSHVFGGSVVMAAALSNGAALSLLRRFDAGDTLEMIATDRLTIFAGVPSMYNAILHESADKPADTSTLRVCLSGGASLPDEVLKGFAERLGTAILEGYGLTETAGAATFNGLHRPRKAGYVGLPMPGTSVRVVDTEGNDVGPEEVGEVLIKGPTVMKGYRGRLEATAETIRDGWLHTGDLGARDAEGDLQIVDRIKDLIIRGGYNIYPREVEEVLYGHPDIVEVVVAGVDDDHFGEEVAAVVALRPGAEPDAEAIRLWAKERLSRYKVPRLWQFVDALPKGSTGKVLKREIDRAGFSRRTSDQGGGPRRSPLHAV